MGLTQSIEDLHRIERLSNRKLLLPDCFELGFGLSLPSDLNWNIGFSWILSLLAFRSELCHQLSWGLLANCRSWDLSASIIMWANSICHIWYVIYDIWIRYIIYDLLHVIDNIYDIWYIHSLYIRYIFPNEKHTHCLLFPFYSSLNINIAVMFRAVTVLQPQEKGQTHRCCQITEAQAAVTHLSASGNTMQVNRDG